ncbi:MAG: thioredoxin domain-containing protein [Clostridia bacterium]|nr:thioredoxin domain-containing protein [Clostridia bacterium]
MSNRLAHETSPYLLQHKDNPVDWYPWGDEAFERARKEDKPIFLSIGYSACHWCHVFAHESFEDAEIAELLNQYFISVKVDKEERPDIDSVYMTVCQAFTGSGGWPTSIFMTADGKPFFAGTYFPKTAQHHTIGFRELLLLIREKWATHRKELFRDAEEIVRQLNRTETLSGDADPDLSTLAVIQFERMYDEKHGGFGRAPKFPSAHNLLFLLEYYKRYGNDSCLRMAEQTLLRMYLGGLFDHIGFGFCRYSTDKKFLVPHFEKMLYDNALLLLAYCSAYTVTNDVLWLDIAEKTAAYILREMISPEGGFYSSQDADADGEEGKYYLFTPEEVIGVLGREPGESFNRRYDITETGNFEGKNIPNLLKHGPAGVSGAAELSALAEYRRKRFSLHRDEKILTSWNSLMITAMCALYRVSKKDIYLSAAQGADRFIQQHLCDGDTLYVSFHMGKLGARGFLDDYAAYIVAQLSLYYATLDSTYLNTAKRLCGKVLAEFADTEGGFYLYSNNHEALILRPKETYDGAMPSGNALMACALVRIAQLTGDPHDQCEAARQLHFLTQSAAPSPANHAMFLTALLEHTRPPMKITVVPEPQADIRCCARALPPDAVVVLLPGPTVEYPLKNGRTTYYVCREHSCLPPVNDLSELD